MRRFGKRIMNESNNHDDHYSGDTFYIKKKGGSVHDIFKVEINQDDLGLEDIIGDAYTEWMACAILEDDSSTLSSMFDNSNVDDVVRKALDSDSSNKKLYTIDWNVETSRPWINYEEVDLTDSEYEDVVNDIRNDEYIDFSVFNGNAIAFCDEEAIDGLISDIQTYMEYGSCGFNIEKMELSTDEESIVESDDTSENDSCYGFINDGETVMNGIVDYFGDYEEIDEEDAIEELRAKADYDREEDDGMRESVMRSRLRRGRMLRESRRPRGRMLMERVGTQGRYMSDEDIAAQYADFWADWIEKRPNGISINVVYPSADEEDYDSSVVFWMKKMDGKWYDFNGNWAPDDVIGKIIKITDVADKVMGDSDEISFENPEEFYSWLRENKSIRESRRPHGRILREGRRPRSRK